MVRAVICRLSVDCQMIVAEQYLCALLLNRRNPVGNEKRTALSVIRLASSF
jgi:hypothetical protein